MFITESQINRIAEAAGLEVVRTKMRPYGREWQAIIYFTETTGVSLLYEFPYIGPKPPQGDDYSIGLIEASDDTEGFSLCDDDQCVYDVTEQDIIDYLQEIDWSQQPPTPF